MAIEPLNTEFGRKRRINQSSCNKDFSCVEGFCPSFVTVHGGRLRKPEATAPLSQYLPPVPEPILPEINERFSRAGGRHRRLRRRHHQPDGRRRRLSRWTLQLQSRPDRQPEVRAVTAHVRIARDPQALHATRIAAGEADALIGCDLSSPRATKPSPSSSAARRAR